MSQIETATPPADSAIPKDPIVHKSYSVHIAIASLALVVATVLAVVDEGWWRRPYKGIQGQYRETYSAYLGKVEAKRRAFVDGVLEHVAEFEALKKRANDAAAECADAAATVQAKLTTATDKSRKLGAALKVSKSEIAALTYESEHKAHADGFKKVDESPAAKPVVEEIEAIRNREIEFTWTVTTYAGKDEEGGAKTSTAEETEKGRVADLLVKALDLEAEKATLQNDLGKANKPASEAAKARDQWLADNLGNLAYAMTNVDDTTRSVIAASGAAAYIDDDVVTLRPKTLGDLKAKVEEIPTGVFSALRGDIRQIHIAEARNWVDRCETCHLNTREPLPITVDSLKRVLGETVTAPPATPGEEPTTLPAWDASKIESMPLALFTSHPNVDLLKTHDPERFGCSMCHNGNGVAITSAELAHGENHHWLQPLYPKENVEAGCVQCHQQDLVLPMGDRITAGKDTFRRVACWGCHRYEGFNTELESVTAFDGRLKVIDEESKAKALRRENLQAVLNALDQDVEAQKKAYDRDFPANLREREALTQEISALAVERAQVTKRIAGLYVERQRAGPNLKDVKIKLLPEFVTEWIRNPREAHKDVAGNAFRPDTKMPEFRWQDDEEAKDVAAFVHQRAIDPSEFEAYRLPAFVAGDAKKGEELFNTRGCLACHAMGTGTAKIGNDYAANLSNLGEKNRPEYVARWITHPRERLVPYDLKQKKDVAGGAKDDPNLVWTQHTIMPDFRLSESEVRDITTYLMSQKRADVKYEKPTWLDDKERAKRGEKLVVYQGCAGCHEIRGLEDEKGIGTELTKEGSKSIDLLDFGHLTVAAKRGKEPLKGVDLLEDAEKLFEEEHHWFRPRNFFLHKIAKPDLYDESKYLPDRFNRLRMPQFKFTAQEILDVTSFVLGSVDSQIPASFRYDPDADGKAIREGWWIVKKYNCRGCHQVTPDEVPSIWNTPEYADKTDSKNRDANLPPTLVGVGFRLKPDWMAKFLRDPSMGGGRARPESTRAHLKIRMPTFDFSEEEIEKLVLFFSAMAKQQPVYQPEVVKPLEGKELAAASAIWKAANCMQCHVVDGQAFTSETKAPNLSYAPARLRPEWMKRWISNPPAMQPATAMTKFFGEEPGPDGKWHYMPGSKPLPELEGITADQVDLMVRYLVQGLAGK